MLTVDVVTLFPEVVAPYLSASIPGRASAAGLVRFRLVQLRDFTHDRHATVDDYPYGGGAGMVVRVDIVARALEEAYGVPARKVRDERRVVLTEPAGRRLTQGYVDEVAVGPDLTVICGRYGGTDERVWSNLATEAVSLGDFVLSGGEPAALCVIDAVVRLLPGAMSDHESASSDSHYDGLLSPPSYTRPPEYRGLEVPEVLRSGNHAEISAWRQKESERLTRERRPDLWEKHEKSHRE